MAKERTSISTRKPRHVSRLPQPIPELRIPYTGPASQPPGRLPLRCKFVIYKGKNREWWWRFTAANGQIMAGSTEGYKNKQDCLTAINYVQEHAGATIIQVTNKKVL